MTEIRVNVFNLTPLNKVLSFAKIGVYHTSVVIGNKYEYYYGFAREGITGIDEPEVLHCLPSSMAGTFHSHYIMGECQLSIKECKDIVRQFKRSPIWMSEEYQVLYHNCNHFSYELCEVLLGVNNMSNYPSWVTRGEIIGRIIYSVSLSHFLGFVKNIPGIGYEKETTKTSLEQSENLVEEI